MKIKTLSELRDAFEFGNVPDDVVLVLDNDNTFVYVEEECVFEMDPHDVLRQALDLLNIPHDEA